MNAGFQLHNVLFHHILPLGPEQGGIFGLPQLEAQPVGADDVQP